MEIKTEKTHIILLSDDELNSLRCFIDDAIEAGIWQEWREEQEDIRLFHDMALDALRG